jgi:hypothetical protein
MHLGNCYPGEEKIKDKPVSIARGVNDKEDFFVVLRPPRNDGKE